MKNKMTIILIKRKIMILDFFTMIIMITIMENKSNSNNINNTKPITMSKNIRKITIKITMMMYNMFEKNNKFLCIINKNY